MNPHGVSILPVCICTPAVRTCASEDSITCLLPKVSPHSPSSPHATHPLFWRHPKESGYCSRGHHAHAIALGQGMRTVTSHVEQVFRGGTTGATDFMLSVLSKSHHQYSSLCHQFISKWVKRGMPHVRRILEVKVSEIIHERTHLMVPPNLIHSLFCAQSSWLVGFEVGC